MQFVISNNIFNLLKKEKEEEEEEKVGVFVAEAAEEKEVKYL